jgi:hypothetical protein
VYTRELIHLLLLGDLDHEVELLVMGKPVPLAHVRSSEIAGTTFICGGRSSTEDIFTINKIERGRVPNPTLGQLLRSGAVKRLPSSNDEILYQIQDASTGLYSTGGCNPRWTRKGKVWKTPAHVVSHLKLFQRGPLEKERRRIPRTWRVVEVPRGGARLLNIVPAIDWLKGHQ